MFSALSYSDYSMMEITVAKTEYENSKLIFHKPLDRGTTIQRNLRFPNTSFIA